MGQDRLLAIVESCSAASSCEIADAMLGAALDFAGGRLVDDAALVVIKAGDGEER
jgi:serine phosphatase RsbU (regulator of sigma subunit)